LGVKSTNYHEYTLHITRKIVDESMTVNCMSKIGLINERLNNKLIKAIDFLPSPGGRHIGLIGV